MQFAEIPQAACKTSPRTPEGKCARMPPIVEQNLSKALPDSPRCTQRRSPQNVALMWPRHPKDFAKVPKDIRIQLPKTARRIWPRPGEQFERPPSPPSPRKRPRMTPRCGQDLTKDFEYLAQALHKANSRQWPQDLINTPQDFVKPKKDHLKYLTRPPKQIARLPQGIPKAIEPTMPQRIGQWLPKTCPPPGLPKAFAQECPQDLAQRPRGL